MANQNFERDSEDTWLWKEEEQRVFGARCVYNTLQDTLNEENTYLFNVFWSLKVLPTAKHFARRVLLNKVPTKDNLAQIMTNFKHFHLSNLNEKQNKVWKVVWVAIVRAIQIHINNIIFKQKKVDVVEIFSVAQLNACLWVKNKISTVRFSYSDWYWCPFECLKTM